jgi:hypothetical protein
MRHTNVQVLNQPIQFWFPWLEDNLASPETQRDAHRAVKEWNGQLKVWLLPKLKKNKQWRETMGEIRFRVLGVPAEHCDRLDVYHIGCNGEIFGLASRSLFPQGLNGLLDTWLNLYNLDGGPTFYNAPRTFTFEAPEVKKSGIKYTYSKFRIAPGPTWPFVAVNKSKRIVTMKWPPSDRNAAPVSPETESAEYYGPLTRVEHGRMPIAVSDRDPNFCSLHIVCLLPKPLEQLAPYGVGMDTLAGQAKMAQIARLSVSNSMGALKEAKEAAGVYVAEGQTTQELGWYFPTLRKEGIDRALHLASFRFNLEEHAIVEDTMASPVWKAEMTKSIPIRRAWGILGLFWSLLLDRLERGEKFDMCKNCGRTISGRKGKQYCGKEHGDCYRARRAAARRRERIEHNRLDRS